MLDIKEIKHITKHIKESVEYKLGKKMVEGITPVINTDDDFINFIKYRVREKFDDAEDIIKIIEQPHHYVSDYITFLKEEVYGEYLSDRDTEDALKNVPNSHTNTQRE